MYTYIYVKQYFPQVALGPRDDDLVIIGTSETYNDGKWHKLDAGRLYSNCSLKVDGETLRAVSTSPVKEINAIDKMNFGGNNKGIMRVTDKGFDGCITQISIARDNIELTNSLEAVGMAYGCQVRDSFYTW